MPDITDEELAILRGSKKLMDELLKSPKTKRDTERAIKTLHPDVRTVDDDLAPVAEEISETRKELAALKKQLDDARIDGKLNSAFAQLRDAGYTEEGLEKIKKLMVDEGIPNPLAAAAFWEKQNPPKSQEPSSWAPQTWGFGGTSQDENLKALFNDEDSWAERTAHETWESAKKGQILT